MNTIRLHIGRVVIIVIILLSMLSNNAHSQQLPLSSQYMFNKFLINPAATGSSKFMELRLNSRKQWVGIDGAPVTHNLSLHKLLNNKTMGLGVSVFSDNYGPESKVGFKISYSYIIPVSSIESNLAMGLAFHGFQYSLDYNVLVPYDLGDPTLQEGTQTAFVPDADFGIYLYNERYTFGISANQLINIPVNIGNAEYSNNSMIRHYYIIGSYKFNLSKAIDFEPSTLIKGTEVSPLQADLNFRFIFNNRYWVSASYRTLNATIVMVGINFNNFIFGYSYDYSFGEIQHYQTGSHEIILGYNFGQVYTSNSLLNSIRQF